MNDNHRRQMEHARKMAMNDLKEHAGYEPLVREGRMKMQEEMRRMKYDNTPMHDDKPRFI